MQERARFIQMIKKIESSQLKPGMYIHDVDAQWTEGPFFGKGVKISNVETVEQIVKLGIPEVYIDTDKGLDIDGNFQTEAGEREDRKEPVQRADIQYASILPVSVGEEIMQAKKVQHQAMETVKNTMDDIRSGRQIEKENVEDTVDDIIVSVLRNQGALSSLGRLRKTNEYFYKHSISVCVMMVSFGRYLEYEPQVLREVAVGALLHDVGTLKVSPHILNKTSKLNEEEYNEIKKHVEYSREILEQTEGISGKSIMTACEHHERIDGSGYPKGLKGDEISPVGQAIAIVDTYDALSTKRCYRRKIPPTQALHMIYEMSDTHFNRDLVQKFIRCIGIYPIGSLVRLESGLIGVVVKHSEDNLLQPVIRVIYDTKRDRYMIVPFDIDLASPEGSEKGGRIVTYALQEDFNVQPEMYL